METVSSVWRLGGFRGGGFDGFNNEWGRRPEGTEGQRGRGFGEWAARETGWATEGIRRGAEAGALMEGDKRSVTLSARI